MATELLLSVGDGTTTGYLDLIEPPYGLVEGSWDTSEPGRVRFTLEISGTSGNDLDLNIAAILTKLRQAENAAQPGAYGDWVTLGVALGGMSKRVYYDILNGTVTIRPESHTAPILEVSHTVLADIELRTLEHPRGESYAQTLNGTLTNGAIAWLIENVPGDADALVRLAITDVSTNGKFINRLRFALASAEGIALGDWDPWVDVTAVSPATTQADASAFGGNYARRSITPGGGYLAIARAVMPSGAQNKGRRNVWIRARDNATAMSAPTSFDGTVTESTTTTVETSAITPAVLSLSQVKTATTTSGSTIAATWSPTTVSGNGWFAAIETRWNTGAVDLAITPPAGWTFVGRLTAGVGAERTWLHLFARENAPSSSASQSFSLSESATLVRAVLIMAEVNNAILAGLIDRFAMEAMLTADLENGVVKLDAGETTFPGEMVLMVASPRWDYTGSVGGGFSAWLSGQTEQADTQFFGLGSRVYGQAQTGSTLSETIPAVSSGTVLGYLSAVISLRPKLTTIVSSTEVPQEPFAGDLLAGTYSLRLQAVDVSGRVSNATSTIIETVTKPNGRIDLTWTAPAGQISHYLLSWQRGAVIRQIATPNATTSYSLTTETGAKIISALPSTVGATASPNPLRLRAGTLNGTLSAIDRQILVPSGGQWFLVNGGLLDLPPVERLVDGSRPDWAIEIDAISGGGAAANVEVDAVFLAPHDHPQLTVEVPGLTLVALRNWLIETHRSGKSMSGWLRDTGTSAEAGRITPVGVLTLPPGDVILAMAADVVSGVSDMVDAKVQAAMTIYPRFKWQRGNR